MSRGRFALRVEPHAIGDTLLWLRDGAPALALPTAATIEIGPKDSHDVGGERHAAPYAQCSRVGNRVTGQAEITTPQGRFRVTDQWERVGGDTWRVDRKLEAIEVKGTIGARLVLELLPASPKRSYGDFRYFAPPALYDLNDLNDDGIEEYLDTRSLHFREDRLNLRTVLAYNEAARLGVALSRSDRPEFDPPAKRNSGEQAFIQATDICSLGIEPQGDGGVSLIAAYPFAERTRSHALLVKERVPFAAFWPATEGVVLGASYFIRFVEAGNVHDALWSVWTRRLDELKPEPVALAAPLDQIAAHRLDALMRYYIEEKEPPFAAGFVTNCHPQDGKQLSNVIQFGFTGQNNQNAFNLLRAGGGDPDRTRKALRVIDFFAVAAAKSKFGLVPGFYNADTRKFGSWWTGLILPLAYAEPGGDLEKLMGPLYGHLQPVIEALAGHDGVYLRCVAEEYDALLAAYRHQRDHGGEQPTWLATCNTFADFLLSVQEPDGSWFRAYTFAGEQITEPENWFGQTEVQRKSSTATAVPFLLGLHELTGDQRLLAAARRAGDFARKHFVDPIRHNGGIHDSIYAKPQLVDGESIMFCMRALLLLHKATGDQGYLDGARRAAQLVVTWICLWDVPLPPQSTLARYGFRSTGWMACDAPGAGYIHPMGVLAVPDLIEIGLLTGDDHFLRAAELLQAGCNSTVETQARSWGYTFPGLQEEGLLISWWFADDPMFGETGFGGRGKGEGNKTCFPWIPAVSVYAHRELLARYGTTDIGAIRRGASLDSRG